MRFFYSIGYFFVLENKACKVGICPFRNAGLFFLRIRSSRKASIYEAFPNREVLFRWSFKIMNDSVFISGEKFLDLLNEGMIVDARDGGLVIGRSHKDGNIYMIRQLFDSDNYEIFAHMEGGEYIICHDAYIKYKDTIENINSFHGTEYNVDIEEVCKSPVLLTSAPFEDKYLFIDARGQFIVNKYATCLFLKELNLINKSAF